MNKKLNKENDAFLKNDDLKIIENIAEKYCITIQELGRILARRTGVYPRLQILLNTDELNIIDSKANKLNLSRTKYCSLCYKKALKENLYENINVLQAMSDNKNKNLKRKHRAVISFDNAKDYRNMKKLSDDLGIPFSSLMRYFALTVNIE